MRITCLICSDLFDGINSQIATPCGHIFHEICLLQWLNNSKTCPSCRQRVVPKALIRLYFDVADEGDNQVSPESLENEVDALKAKCKQKDMEKEKLSQKIDELRTYVIKAEDERDVFKQKYYTKKNVVQEFGTQIKHLSKEISRLKQVEEENMALHNNLEHMKRVQLVIEGTSKDVEDMLGKCEETSDAKQIATYCVLLKRELVSAMEQKDKFQNRVQALKQDGANKVVQLSEMKNETDALRDKISNLRTMIERLESENESLNDKLKSLQASALFDSPVPVALKRPKLHKKKVSTSDSSSDSETNQPVATKKRPRSNEASTFTFSKAIPARLAFGTSSAFNPSKHPNSRKLGSIANASLIREGYNGLGGHSRFIARSTDIRKKTAPLKRSKTVS